jgi:hypothetical protein
MNNDTQTTKTKQFGYLSVNDMQYDGKKVFWFECAMVSACAPLFDHCDSNYEVEDLLRKAKVLHKRNQTDSESCALVVNFSSEKSAQKFIDRLNAFLVKRHQQLTELRAV